MDKTLEGDLSRFHVPDVLTFLNLARNTGVLVLERPLQETKLFLREGTPVFATSTRDELRLGSMLVRHGRVSAERLEAVLARQKDGHRIGQVLVAEKLLDEAALGSFLKVQVSEVIFETFEWSAGLFTFWDRVPAPATAVILEMDLQNLIMEGVRRIDERSRLTEVFPDLGMVVEAVTNPERVKQSVTLTPEEWKIFFLVDGRRTLSEICRLSGSPDDLATLQVVYNLVRAKFVAVVAPPLAVPEEEKPPPAVGTVKFVEGRPAPAVAAPVSVAFTPAMPVRKPEDDTREVVTPKAIHYLGSEPTSAVSRLILLSDAAQPFFPLSRDSYTLGRHKNNDIVVNDPKVSSFHARIDKSGNGFLVVDLKSRNGSFLNGKRVETALLKTGDELRMGAARLQFRAD
jgi:hypothetical protein